MDESRKELSFGMDWILGTASNESEKKSEPKTRYRRNALKTNAVQENLTPEEISLKKHVNKMVTDVKYRKLYLQIRKEEEELTLEKFQSFMKKTIPKSNPIPVPYVPPVGEDRETHLKTCTKGIACLLCGAFRVFTLNQAFSQSKYISDDGCKVLAEKTRLTVRAIKYWFFIRRSYQRFNLGPQTCPDLPPNLVTEIHRQWAAQRAACQQKNATTLAKSCIKTTAKKNQFL